VSAAPYAAVKSLLERVLAAEPDERDALLANAPAPIADEVRQLLGAEDVLSDSFLDPEAGAPVLDDIGDDLIGERVGPWRVEGVLGEGGMGRVYTALRDDGAYEQAVALKVVKRGMDSRAVLRRFEAERRILARLDHPGIAQLLDGGTTDDGRPYFAMALVEGEPIVAYADRHALDVTARLGLLLQTAEAVAHAHRHLVVHRDLKPSNVLVTQGEDGRPVVKLLDFGIARLLEDDGDALTETGLRPMSRPYAAPEQIADEPITTATDVWALGVLLYEVLTGRRPFRADSRAGLETAILDAAPTLPSAAASRNETTTAGTGPSLARRLRGDLDAICLSALSRAPERRYPTADAFAADLRRHLDGLPVEARPPAAGYRVRKFVARHRAAVGVAAVALAMLLIGATTYTVRLQAERDRAEAALEESERAVGFLQDVFVTADPFQSTRRDTLRLRDLLDEAALRVGSDFADDSLLQARIWTGIARAYSGQWRVEEADSLFRLVPPRLAGAWTQTRADALREHAQLLTRGEPDELEQAVEYLQQVAAYYDREHGPDDPQGAAVHGSIATANLRLYRYDEADEAFRESLRRYAAQTELDTTGYAAVLGQHALLLNDRGHADEALAAQLESVRLAEAQLGPDHPRTAARLYNLGLLYYDAGRYDEAAATYRRVWDIDAQALGEEHPNTLDAIRKLGLMQTLQGRPEEGLPLLRDALARVRAGRPEMAARATSYQMDLARGLLHAGRPEEAIAQLEGLRPDWTDVPISPVRLAMAAVIRGQALLASGRPEAALAAVSEGLPVLAEAFPPATPPLVDARETHARALIALGRAREARTPLQQALLATRIRFGADHARTRALRELRDGTE